MSSQRFFLPVGERGVIKGGGGECEMDVKRTQGVEDGGKGPGLGLKVCRQPRCHLP